MSDELTQAELVELEARSAAATPGPWRRGRVDEEAKVWLERRPELVAWLKSLRKRHP